jgi:hypothetical protein
VWEGVVAVSFALGLGQQSLNEVLISSSDIIKGAAEIRHHNMHWIINIFSYISLII